MNARSTVSLITAPSRSGKTYLEVRWLVEEFLPEKNGHYWCNLPLFIDKISAYCSEKYGGKAEDYAARIHIIPDEVMQSWKDGESGPWDYFADVDLSGAFIAIDEIHNYAAKGGHRQEHLHGWSKWLGEAGHMGCKLRFITQNLSKVADVISREAATQIQLVNQEDNRDPWFGIYCGDWYEIRSKLFRLPYLATVIQIEKREVDRRWVEMDRTAFIRWPKYFPLYNSYSKPQQSGQSGKPEQRAYERLGWIPFLWYIFRRSPIRVSLRIAFGAFIIWLLMGGGGVLMGMMIKSAMHGMHVPTESVRSNSSSPPPPAAVAAAFPGPPALRPGSSGRPPAAAGTQPDPERERLEAELGKARKELEKLGELTFLGKDRVGFKDGSIWVIGETIDRGSHVGKQVSWVDMVRGSCGLSDGSILRLGL